MRSCFSMLFILSALVASCLTFTGARAQQYYPPQGQYPPPQGQYDQQGREEHERREHREMREEDWRRHNERYFGGIVVQPYPNESPEHYRDRMYAQCNIVWNGCVTRCNEIGNPYQRAACVGSCNNELYECKSNF